MATQSHFNPERNHEIAAAMVENSWSGSIVLFALDELGPLKISDLEVAFANEGVEPEVSPQSGVGSLLAVGLIAQAGEFYHLTTDGQEIVTKLMRIENRAKGIQALEE